MYTIVILGSIIMGFIGWRVIRGGGFTDATGISLTTTGGRALCAILFCGWCLLITVLRHLSFSWWFLCEIPALFIGLSAVGWGPFMSVGTGDSNKQAASPYSWLPLRMGFSYNSTALDFIGMLECGMACLAPSIGLYVGLHLRFWPLLLVSVLFAPVYYVMDRVNLPKWIFCTSQEAWAEAVIGPLVLLALTFGCLR